jgi:hypothetical protein
MGSGPGERSRQRPGSERADRYSTSAKVATKTRTKGSVRPAKGKGGRRPPARVKSGRDIPGLPIAILAVLVVLTIGLILYIRSNSPVPASAPATVAGVPCDRGEHTQVHYHSALQIMYQGTVVDLPSTVGILGDPTAPTCYYWLHVHAGQPNVIHIESPANDTFTLGQFFAIWNSWANATGHPAVALSATQVATYKLTPGQTLNMYIDLQDGKGAQPYTGNPNAIPLKAHEVITLEIAPPVVNPPPAFTFTSGL